MNMNHSSNAVVECKSKWKIAISRKDYYSSANKFSNDILPTELNSKYTK